MSRRAAKQASSLGAGRGTRIAFPLILVLLIALAAGIPYFGVTVGPILPGPLNDAGSLQVLSVAFVTTAVAVTFYLMLGCVGLLPFGHGMYFALGAYCTVLIANNTGIGFYGSALLAVLLGAVISLIANAPALRSTPLAFSMITLAYAELLSTGMGCVVYGVQRGFQGMPSILE